MTKSDRRQQSKGGVTGRSRGTGITVSGYQDKRESRQNNNNIIMGTRHLLYSSTDRRCAFTAEPPFPSDIDALMRNPVAS